MINRFHAPHAEALSVTQAQRMILDCVEASSAVETVALQNALGRITASDIISPIDVPAYDNSAMDGYAFHSASLQAATSTLAIVGSAYAGRAFSGTIKEGECIRIMTGAVLPDDCDTVVAQEYVEASEYSMSITGSSIKPGSNRRLRGEDLRAGSIALPQGKILRPADIGLLASLGIQDIAVHKPLRVACFSTGDELRSIGETLDTGCIYDSNRYTLHGMLSRLGCDIIDLGVIRDDPAALESALRTACMQADVIITSGGISTGAADYTRLMGEQISAQFGNVQFWKINMRPGRPFAFGQISVQGKSAYLFGLPGNPVATMVSFYILVRAALLQMMGARAAPLALLPAIAQTGMDKKAGRNEYQRGILSIGTDGKAQVALTGAQGSGMLRSMAEANCLVMLQQEQGYVNAGDMVDVLMFEGLV